MNAIKKLWRNIANFAPWKAILIAWVIQFVVMLVFYVAFFILTGVVIPSPLRFILEMVVLYFIFTRVYKWIYPHGWRGGFWNE